MIRFKLLLTLLILISSTINGQTSDDPYRSLRGLKSGTLLRIEADNLGPICGTFDRVSAKNDTLYLKPTPQAPNSATASLMTKDNDGLGLQYQPLSTPVNIFNQEISRVYRHGNKGGTGALIGALLGAAIWIAVWDDENSTDPYSGMKDDSSEGFYSALGGAAIGGLVGLIIPSWKEVYSRE